MRKGAKKMKYVIIGSSIAAIGCIEGIRSVDKKSEITIISKEDTFIYSRPLISYLIEEKTSLEKMRYREDDFYEKQNCKTYLGREVIKIDDKHKCVILDNDKKISYDKLMIATGSRPFVPEIKGIEKVENKFNFMTLDDALSLQKAVGSDSSKKVLILGAGLIGLKCAEAVINKTKSVTVVDLAKRILPSILDEEGCKIVTKHIKDKGINLILDDSIKSIDEDKATLSSGKEVEYDIFVIAVGVRANIELAKEIGIETNRGIITDEKGRTSKEKIYAAGDCTTSYDITSEDTKVLALLPNAYLKGEAAGINMAGGDKIYDSAIPMNSLGLFGLHMVTAGSYEGESYITLNENEKNYKRLIYKDNLLKGFIIIGDVRRSGIYTKLIREKVDLRQIDFELIKDKPQLMAFSRKYRDETLGGIK